ncbi:MAG: hypothetical protein OXG58_01990 [Gemmatimonadetes bacterium]|nr:hypothetical protein [Gemmatimonadota bacterium]MCY3943609.1 hypothetical protein [Gemmatimonadota bacterium]
MHLTQEDRDWIASAIKKGVREELKPIEQRLERGFEATGRGFKVVNQKIDALESMRKPKGGPAPSDLPLAAKDR